MRKRSLACGPTMGQLIGYKAGCKWVISLYTRHEASYIHTQQHRKTDIWGLWSSRLCTSRMTLFVISSQILAENGDRSLMACNIALESHHAKGQVCLKFALQCISGDDLDFLSLIPPRVQGRERETASFQPPTPPVF